MKLIRILTVIVVAMIWQSCFLTTEGPAGKDGWLKGRTHEKIDTITMHLRGFDMAMVETDYRYQELYWAGQDTNWDYATYQIDKIRTTIENGLQRRPKRAQSAHQFLNEAIPNMKEAISTRDSLVFYENFMMLTDACNACHELEKVPHFSVKYPLTRQSSIRR